MRIAGLVLLVALVATLGLLACVAPVTPAPGATPLPAATPTSTSPPAFMPPSTLLPPPTPYGLTITPPPGAVPVFTVTKSYTPVTGFSPTAPKDTFEAKKGDIVVLSAEAKTATVIVAVDDPAGGAALTPKAVYVNRPARYSFRAEQDGKYTVFGGTDPMAGASASLTLTIDIYR